MQSNVKSRLIEFLKFKSIVKRHLHKAWGFLPVLLMQFGYQFNQKRSKKYLMFIQI